MDSNKQKSHSPPQSSINFDPDDRPTISAGESDQVPDGRDIATVSDSVYVSLSRHGQILSAGRMLKSDRFPGCERHMKDQPTIDGVPNWRKVDLLVLRAQEENESSNNNNNVNVPVGAGVFGCAQPTRTGIRNAVDYLAAEGYEKVVWVNMREEYVVYIGENSYCVKDRLDPFSNINLNGIKYQNLEESEETLCKELTKESLRFRKNSAVVVDEDGGAAAAHLRRVMLMDEAPKPDDAFFGIPYHWWCYDHLESLSTIRQLYEEQGQNDSAIPVSYWRVPVTDEQAPSTKDVDDLIEFLRDCDDTDDGSCSPEEKKKIAFVFNCQMGRGRTTTAMVIASMVLTAAAAAIAGTSETDENSGTGNSNNNSSETNNPKLPDHPSLFLSTMCTILNEIEGIESKEVCNFVDAIINECHLMQNLRSEVGARCDGHTQRRQSLLSHFKSTSTNDFLVEETDKYGRNHDASKMVLKKVNKDATASEVYCNYLERYLFLLLIGAYVQTGTTDAFTVWLDRMPSVSKQYWCLIETLNRNA